MHGILFCDTVIPSKNIFFSVIKSILKGASSTLFFFLLPTIKSESIFVWHSHLSIILLLIKLANWFCQMLYQFIPVLYIVHK